MDEPIEEILGERLPRSNIGRPLDVSDRALLEFIENSPSPISSTRDVAEYFDYAPRTARRRLHALKEAGLVETRIVGRTRIWWPSEEVEAN